jgi:hypothetical protein
MLIEPKGCGSARQRHQPAAAGDFEFTKNGVKMFFHHGETQGNLIGDFLIALTFTNEECDLLLASSESREMWQRHGAASGPGSFFAFNKELWACQAG